MSPASKALAACAGLLLLALAWHGYEPRTRARPLDHAAPKTAIDLNTADRGTLLQVPGLGEKSVDAILARRAVIGRFHDLNELDSVPGIGPKTLDAIAPWLTIGPGQPVESKVETLLRSKPAASTNTVNVNSATAEELQKLPGIGIKLAERIILERGNGSFKNLEDLRRVPGIGPKTLDKLRPLVRFD
jgi:competence protein ComEA